ncbi:DUF4913 domain-containing protein [Nocardia sp. NPDC004582]
MTSTEATEEVVDVYNNVTEWVEDWLVQSVAFKQQGGGKGKIFCKQWWRHKPVVVRLHALWREWERANREDTMSSWWAYHADAAIRALCDGETGPMWRCTTDSHIDVRSLEVTPVPPGWFGTMSGAQTSDNPDFDDDLDDKDL